MDVSIIIINYNTSNLCIQCIESIIKHTFDLDYEIIIVDNNSNDPDINKLKNQKQIKYIQSGINLGFGKANNLGFTQSEGKYIFLLNSDTLLINNAVKEFYDYCENNSRENIGCVGSLLYDPNGNIIHSYGSFPTLSSIIRQFLSYYIPFIKKEKRYNNISQYPKIVDYITGADLFIPRKNIEKFKLFHPSFFMYYEDTYLQFHYKTKGLKSIIISSPKIIHLEGESSKNITSLSKWLMGETGQFNYCRLAMDKSSRFLISIASVIMLYPIIILFPTNIKEKIKALKTLNKILPI